ncbi:hypothetical protein SRHO_G00117130 [Serrasalmus rhombeus]
MSYKRESESLSSSKPRYRQREKHSELQTPAEKMEMKMSWVCLVLGLVLLMTVSSDATTSDLGFPDKCCFHFAHFSIPYNEILKVEKLHSGCPHKGYVITTPRAKICKKDFVHSQL